MEEEISHFPCMEELEPRYQLPFWSLPRPLCHAVPKEPEDTKVPRLYCPWDRSLELQGLLQPAHRRSVWRPRKSVSASRVLIAGGQRIDVGVVEKRVVAIPPGEGL